MSEEHRTFTIANYVNDWDITKDNRHRGCGGYMAMQWSGTKCSKCGGTNCA